MDTRLWEQYVPDFREKTALFYNGELSKGDYKAFSGFYGSYAQRDGHANMLRLRMPAGRVSKSNLEFVAKVARKYQIPRLHFTTCQTIQLHDVAPECIADLILDALDAGIMTIGGGGDYPRNVMCPPLSGVEKGEYFDVMPWAEAAGEYLLTLINEQKMPRKLKVGFSNSKSNITHATFRDLGFVASETGKFDVYSAGGLGPNPCFGVKVAQDIEPEMILYYIKAMWMTFLAYGNYQSRVKGRTRYMQESLGGKKPYAAAFQKKLEEALSSGEDLRIQAAAQVYTKQGDGGWISDSRVLAQKQDGLYAVIWHPIGGMADVHAFCMLSNAVCNMDAVEMRLGPDETAYIINLTAKEAEKILEITKGSASSPFEMSVSCIGASVCQIGLRDSQALLAACIQAVRKAGIKGGALPQIHISGCPSSCGTHQVGILGLRGAVKKIGQKPYPGFLLYVNGCARRGQEEFGQEIGVLLESRVPDFIVKLGKTVQESGMDFLQWKEKNPDGVAKIAEEYVNES